jgi:hypothetical protein
MKKNAIFNGKEVDFPKVFLPGLIHMAEINEVKLERHGEKLFLNKKEITEEKFSELSSYLIDFWDVDVIE